MASVLGTVSRWYLQTQVRDLLEKCNFDLDQYRKQFALKAGPFPLMPSGVQSRSDKIVGVDCEWLVPRKVLYPDKLVLFFHGGGFVLDIQKSHYEFCASMARALGVKFLLVKYRLAPEHPFPAAPEDCFAVYRELLAGGVKAKHVIFAGDSAGGGLALSTVAMAQTARLDLPAGLIAMSPVTGFGFSKWQDGVAGDSDQMFSRATFEYFVRQYVGSAQIREDVRLMPIMTGFKGFPPLLVTASENEFLYPESSEAVALAKQNGVEVEFYTAKDLFHVFPLMGLLPEARAVRGKMLAFVRKVWALPVR